MIYRFACQRKGDRLDVSGLSNNWRDIVAFRLRSNGDVIVLVREKGHTGWAALGMTEYYPTEYEVLRLTPVDALKSSFDNPLYELPRQKRTKFEGWYRIDETLTSVEPGRDRKKVAELRKFVEAFPA